MSGMYIDGCLSVQVDEKFKQQLSEIDLDQFSLNFNCDVYVDRKPKVSIPEGEVLVSFYFFDETHYSFDTYLQELVNAIYKICGKYPEGHIIESTEGDGTYRVEIDPKTGEIIEDSCSWLLDYPIEINRKCYEYAEKLMAEKEEKKNA